MAGTTISTFVNHGISIGYNGISSPLLVTGNGAVEATLAAGAGIYQSSKQTNASIYNEGFVTGAGDGYKSTFAGGAGVIMKGTGTFFNNGFIGGGYAGGAGGNKGHGLRGGDGVDLLGAVTASNSLDSSDFFSGIEGGEGGGGYTYGGLGGTGVLLGATGASFANAGLVQGGEGGGSYYDGGNGGNGVDITAAATLTNTDDVAGGAGGAILKGYSAGVGGTGVAISGGGSLGNSGLITGGTGGGASRYAVAAGYGGTGVSLYNAQGSNTGTITGGTGGGFSDPGKGFTGGNGGSGGEGIGIGGKSSFANAGTVQGGAGVYGKLVAGSGGLGIYLSKGATVSNSGSIFGGGGAGAGTAGEYAGNGNDGVLIELASLSNAGLIEGGGGGAGPSGGRGAYGALVFYGSLKNTGTIIGGAGGAGTETGGHLGNGGNGGGGVFINGGVFTNAGTVNAGYGGNGATNGTIGNAVLFGDSAGTLVVDAGAVFHGQVAANASYADVLELAGKGKTALTGIGTQFTKFNNISFATGAAWKIEGDAAGLASGQTINGFADGDTIILQGFQEAEVEFSSEGLNLINGSTAETLDLSDLLTGETGVRLVTGGGGNSTISLQKSITKLTLHADNAAYAMGNASTKDITVTNGAILASEDGGKLTDTLVKQGGLAGVVTGGVASNVTLDSGGAFIVASGGGVTGTIKMTGAGNILEIDSPAAPAATISGFKSGDEIEFTGIPDTDKGTVKVKTAGVVTVSAGGETYNLKIAGATVGSKDFTYTSGVLTESGANAPAAMTFLRPRASAAPVAVPDLAAMPMHRETATAMPTAWPASATPPPGAIFEFHQIPHGGIQIMPTLQSG